MTEKPKAKCKTKTEPPPKNEAAAFERFEEFTKRIVSVPKSELRKVPRKHKKPQHR